MANMRITRSSRIWNGTSFRFFILDAGSTLIFLQLIVFNRLLVIIMRCGNGMLVGIAHFEQRKHLVKYKLRDVDERLPYTLIGIRLCQRDIKSQYECAQPDEPYQRGCYADKQVGHEAKH